MPYVIRKLDASDLEESTAVIRSAFATVAEEFGLTEENAPTNGAFMTRERLTDELSRGVEMFGLFADGVQAGFIALECKDAEVYYIEKLAVTPPNRHKGYGRSLLDYACAQARQKGAKRISIGIICENEVLLRWYESYGFIRTGTKVFAHLPFTVCFLEIALQ